MWVGLQQAAVGREGRDSGMSVNTVAEDGSCQERIQSVAMTLVFANQVKGKAETGPSGNRLVSTEPGTLGRLRCRCLLALLHLEPEFLWPPSC